MATKTPKTYRVTHTDDYRAGPHLHVRGPDSEGDNSSSEDEESDTKKSGDEGLSSEEEGPNRYTIELEVGPSLVRVWHLILGIGYYDANQVADFCTTEEAELFAKQQYYLYTGDFPFIVDGMTCAYKSEGSRAEIPVPETMECKLEKPNNDEIEYLLIADGEKVRAHSLNPFAEW